MNKKTFARLNLNYGKEPDEELYELWCYNLRLYDDEEIDKAFNIIMSKDKFFPTLSRILEVIKEVVNKKKIEFDNEDIIREKMKRLNIKPEWLDKKITNTPINKETEEIFEDFNNFIKEFRND